MKFEFVTMGTIAVTAMHVAAITHFIQKFIDCFMHQQTFEQTNLMFL
jgi:hypothetical protein